MARQFTKYPSNYVRAGLFDTSEQTRRQLVSEYTNSGLGWSAIVAELKGTYGLETAKDIADEVEMNRRVQKNKGFWDAYVD